MRPIGIDLFAGAGGMSLGFEQAGFDVAAAVEIDPVHCAVHKFNFPNCAVIPTSVERLTGSAIRTAAGIGNRDIDVVFGGPPCQGFSLIGHRALDDARNRLVLDFVRLVAELKAKAFVFENVKGLTVGKHRTFLCELIEAFEVAGYTVQAPEQVLNAANYGVPQSRERLILMGTQKGLKPPKYPAKQTAFPGMRGDTKGLDLGPTCRDALADVPDADQFEILQIEDCAHTDLYKPISKYAAELSLRAKDSWHFGYPRDWKSKVLTSSARTEHSPISRRRFAETTPGEVEPISRFLKLSPDGIANTLRAGTDSARGAFTSPRPIHYLYPRCVTVREMARLHGFPDWFRFNVTKWHGARQIGNAVPPPMARAVATEVMRAIGRKPKKLSTKIKLGDPMLLRMDVSEAASHFGIIAPIGRRDRKSGAKKRKQHEIEAERLKSVAHA
ncbi:MAG: DNA cytosine methyltransferase [Proteobacteria bacterium]|nr:DNA cytosine methyltransferase [Pseudomonadota bacterium]